MPLNALLLDLILTSLREIKFAQEVNQVLILAKEIVEVLFSLPSIHLTPLLVPLLSELFLLVSDALELE
jgi:hypothetical protein